MDDDSEWGIFVNDVNLMQDEDDMKIVEIDEAPGAAFRALFVHLLSNPEWKARLVPVMSKMVTCCRRLNRIGRFTGKQTMVKHRERVKNLLVAAFDKSPDIETTPAFRERFHQLAEGIATFEVTDESKKGNTVLDAYMVANPYISNKDIKDNAYNAYNASLLQIGIDLKRKNDEYAAAHRESDRIEDEKALKKETKKKKKAEKKESRVAQEKYEIVLQDEKIRRDTLVSTAERAFTGGEPNAVVNAFSEIFCDGIDSNQTTATVWDFLKTMKGVTEFAATLREAEDEHDYIRAMLCDRFNCSGMVDVLEWMWSKQKDNPVYAAGAVVRDKESMAKLQRLVRESSMTFDVEVDVKTVTDVLWRCCVNLSPKQALPELLYLRPPALRVPVAEFRQRMAAERARWQDVFRYADTMAEQVKPGAELYRRTHAVLRLCWAMHATPYRPFSPNGARMQQELEAMKRAPDVVTIE